MTPNSNDKLHSNLEVAKNLLDEVANRINERYGYDEDTAAIFFNDIDKVAELLDHCLLLTNNDN